MKGQISNELQNYEGKLYYTNGEVYGDFKLHLDRFLHSEY